MRKPVQIVTTFKQAGQVSASSLVVLCDDGTLWAMSQVHPTSPIGWEMLPAIPNDDVEPVSEDDVGEEHA